MIDNVVTSLITVLVAFSLIVLTLHWVMEMRGRNRSG